jgi:hypothetical protein
MCAQNQVNKKKEYHKKRYANPKIRRRILETTLAYYWKNREKIMARNKRHRAKNLEKVRRYHREYYRDRYKNDAGFRQRSKQNAKRSREKPERRIKIRRYYRNRRKTDSTYRLSANLRGRVAKALNGINKSANTIKLLGCSIEKLRLYLQKRFERGMSWKNYGYWGWHVDHIKPCSSFNLADPKQQRKCFHYTNLQPLWRKENQTKYAPRLRKP